MASDPKRAVRQTEAPCIGGPADGMRVPIVPKVRPHIDVEGHVSAREASENRWRGMGPKAVRYLAERVRANDADLVIYRPESMSIEHALYYLISGYPREGRS